MQRMLYRRHMNTYTWHFCGNCPDWPQKNFHATTDPGRWGDLCSRCQALLLKGDCTRTYGDGVDEQSGK